MLYMKKYIPLRLLLFSGIAGLIYFGSCKKVDIVTQTTTDLNIYDYLKKNGEQYSEFVAIIDRSGYSGFLNAYGSYTCFAPTNSAVQQYYGEVHKSGADQLTEEEAKNIVKIHLMEDTLTTSTFKDGKLP